MFDEFRRVFGARRDVVSSAGLPWRDDALLTVPGYSSFMDEFAGASFRGGLYRLHDDESGPAAAQWISEMFPTTDIRPFAFDWLGRQFGFDAAAAEDARFRSVLLVEPGTGEILTIPATFDDFHASTLHEYEDAALASGFFLEWVNECGPTLPISHDYCVGYRVPLFLGGADAVTNLELTDMAVYWGVTGQLWLATRAMQPGTGLGSVSIGRGDS